MEHSAKDIYEMHMVVKGHVQGVGFRAMTRYYAQELNVKGTVNNLEDGTVEIYAQGSKKILEQLVQRLKEETNPGQIEETSIEFFPIENSHNDFRILI